MDKDWGMQMWECWSPILEAIFQYSIMILYKICKKYKEYCEIHQLANYILQILHTTTLWSYKLIIKHLLNYPTKFNYIDFAGPLTPSSLMDIWFLVSNKQVICQKSLYDHSVGIRKQTETG